MAKRLDKKTYERELKRMQEELVLLQEAVRADGMRVAVVLEGRDTAGKGGTIKRIMEELNPRSCRVVALGVPTERERGQWYFQRYVERLPSAGEIALFDRSWYNRAGVERVMGFCEEEDVEEFFREAPELERMLIRSGLILVKYWLDVGPQEQLARLTERVDADDQRRARLNLMAHLLELLPRRRDPDVVTIKKPRRKARTPEMPAAAVRVPERW
jgi:polyphosphate kinase